MKNYSIPELIDEQGFLICPVCGKKFKPNDDTKYIAAGGYTCSWKCFLDTAKKYYKDKDDKGRKKKK